MQRPPPAGAGGGGGIGGGGAGGMDPKPAPMCGRHREELKLYCEEDQELVCLVCGLSQDHRSHSLVGVQEAQQRHRVRHRHRFSSLLSVHGISLQNVPLESISVVCLLSFQNVPMISMVYFLSLFCCLFTSFLPSLSLSLSHFNTRL